MIISFSNIVLYNKKLESSQYYQHDLHDSLIPFLLFS